MNMRRIAIRSEDAELCDLLKMWLGDAGYEVSGGGDCAIIDADTCPGEGGEDEKTLYIVSSPGGRAHELRRPFSHTELTSAVRRICSEDAGELVVDPTSKRVTYRGDSVALTAKEYAVMRLLYERGEEGASREEISTVARREGGKETNAGDVYVHYLRRKLSLLTGEPGGEIIRTVRGFGYALTVR